LFILSYDILNLILSQEEREAWDSFQKASGRDAAVRPKHEEARMGRTIIETAGLFNRECNVSPHIVHPDTAGT
jgi:hypothetical protein